MHGFLIVIRLMLPHRLLVDGGYMNIVPADVMVDMGAKKVIAVDVSTEMTRDFFEYGTELSGLWLLWNR